MQKHKVREWLEIVALSAQTLRVQQSQLLSESDWDKERNGLIADTAWKQFNDAHERLWTLLVSEPRVPGVTSDVSTLLRSVEGLEGDPSETLSFEEAIDPANWIEEQRLDTLTFEARLQADGTLYLGGVALREGFSPEAAQALIRFLSERVKLPVVEPPYEFPSDFTPRQVDVESEDTE